MLSIFENVCSCVANTVAICFLSLVFNQDQVIEQDENIDREMAIREMQKDDDWQNIEASEFMKDL